MNEIQFGEIEFQGPGAGLRPDRDAHFSVIECGEIRKHDISIFVDLDVMRDMEAHAQSNRDVELGGVMLGGQFVDEQGQPFVVVSDSLRAEHFEATKGSFKFTHETWQDITRRRDDFSADLQMVGWYHTHPDWGVFLSGMDDFICSHFFNRPLDLALVIDPCRGDRGWFVWTKDSPPRTRRTGGFYLFTNRFREDELKYFQTLYSGESTMALDPRYSGTGSPIIQPVVNINDQRTPIIQVAIIGMLTIQLLVLGLLGFKMLFDSSEQTADKLGELDQKLAALNHIEQMKAKEQAYEQAISLLAGDSRDSADLASHVADLQLRNRETENNLRAQMALTALVESTNRDLNRTNESQLKTIEQSAAKLDEVNNELSSLKQETAELRQEKDGNSKSTGGWMYYLIAAAVGLFGLAGGFWLGGRQAYGGFQSDFNDRKSRAANKGFETDVEADDGDIE